MNKISVQTITAATIKEPTKAARARQLLDQQVDIVLRHPKDCNAASKAKRVLADALLELKHQ